MADQMDEKKDLQGRRIEEPESFLFEKLLPLREPCNTSAVQAVAVKGRIYRIATRNSVYEIEL